MRRLIDSQFGVSARRAAAVVYCRSRADSWIAPRSVVISHPKSGRTWLRLMLAEAHIERVGFSHAGSGEQASLTIEALREIVPHWQRKRVLLLVRDPRDTAVSFFFQATRRSRVVSESLAEFLRNPRFGIERIIKFNLLWLDRRDDFASFKLLAYEQLHENAESALKEAASFLCSRQTGALDLKGAISRTTFDELHKLELSGQGRKKWGFRLAPGDPSDPESFKTRRGMVGGWSEYFSRADRDYAEALLEHHDYFARIGTAESQRSSATCLAAGTSSRVLPARAGRAGYAAMLNK